MPEINFNGIDVSIIDERGEIAALTRGICFNDVGIRTDIISDVPKYVGIKMAIRSLAPKVIIADEIGNSNDSSIINYAVCSGVKCVFTAHGSKLEDILKNAELKKIMNLKLFDKVIILDEKKKGKIKTVINV